MCKLYTLNHLKYLLLQYRQLATYVYFQRNGVLKTIAVNTQYEYHSEKEKKTLFSYTINAQRYDTRYQNNIKFTTNYKSKKVLYIKLIKIIENNI